MGRHDPRGPQDQGIAARRRDPLFAQQFGAAIGPEGGRRMFGRKRSFPCPVKDIIGRDMQEGQAQFGTAPGHGGGGVAVHHSCCGLFRLGLVDGSPGGGVDHQITIGNRGGTGGRVAQIGRVPAKEARRHSHRAAPGEFAGELPGLAEDQNLHVFTPSRTPTPARACSGFHQASLSRYHCTVRSNPSSTVTEGRQPNSVRIRVGSMA